MALPAVFVSSQSPSPRPTPSPPPYPQRDCAGLAPRSPGWEITWKPHSLCSLPEHQEPSDRAIQLFRNALCGIKPVTPAENMLMIQDIHVIQDSPCLTPLHLAAELVPKASAKDCLCRKIVVLRTHKDN